MPNVHGARHRVAAAVLIASTLCLPTLTGCTTHPRGVASAPMHDGERITLDDICDQLGATRQRLETITLTYTFESYKYAESGDSRTVESLHEYSLLSDGERFHLRRNVKSSREAEVPLNVVQHFLFDGSRSIMLAPSDDERPYNLVLVRSGHDEEVAGIYSPYHYVRTLFREFRAPIEQELVREKWTATIRQGPRAYGLRTIEVLLTADPDPATGNVSQMIYWLAPQRGMLPLRRDIQITEAGKEPRVINSVRFEDFTEVQPGLYFPRCIKWGGPDDADIKPFWQLTVTYVQQGKTSDHRPFDVIRPPASVQDEARGRSYFLTKTPEGGEREIDLTAEGAEEEIQREMNALSEP